MPKNTLRLALMLLTTLLFGGCIQDEQAFKEQEPPTVTNPSVSISSPEDRAKIKGNVVELDVEARGIAIVKADGDKSGKTGHYHVFVDRNPVAAGATIPNEPGIIHSTDDPIKLTGLSVGEHEFTVILGDGSHARIGEAEAKVTVEVL